MEVRLARPQYGWSELQIGKWTGTLSYINDAGNDLLWAINRVVTKGEPSVVLFDAEDHEWMMVLNQSEQHILRETDEGWDYQTLDIKIKDLAVPIVQQVADHIDEWAAFPADVEPDSKEFEERRVDMDLLLAIMAHRIGLEYKKSEVNQCE